MELEDGWDFECANCGDCHSLVPDGNGELCYCGCKEYKRGERVLREPTELLREDEGDNTDPPRDWGLVYLLQARLIEAREVVREGIDSVCDCSWCCMARDYMKATSSSVPKE